MPAAPDVAAPPVAPVAVPVVAAFQVVLREERNVNPDLPTGEIELQAASMQVLAESLTPPFPLDVGILNLMAKY